MGPEPALSTIDRVGELEAGSSRLYCLERSPQDTACMSPSGRRGSQEHRAGEGWKMVPSAARVACIVRAACTSLDQNSSKENFSEQSDTMGRIHGYIYTSIYYCCKSFAVLYQCHGGWVDRFVGVTAVLCTAVLL